MDDNPISTLFYFISWAAFIFVMLRICCGAHVMGHSHPRNHADKKKGTESQNLRWIAPEHDTDPVCGKSVQTRNAKSSVFEGDVYYFCSRECREIFEVAPEQYISGSTETLNPMEVGHV